MKEQIKAGWKKVKTWVGNHKAAIVIGSGCVLAGIIGAVVTSGSKKSSEDEEIENFVEACSNNEFSEDEYQDIDRYMVDKDIVDLLPPGTYDVFDGYKNHRVNYVIEEKESMET